jgi:Rps23 Pro-64 3,4-dihydroxylase Tpa1-like proline 4-hydroxylase
MYSDRDHIGRAIASKLREHTAQLRSQWLAAEPVRHFYQDDLLPEEEASRLAGSYPSPDKLMLRSTMRERKRVGVEVGQYDRLVGEYLFAFQHPEVIYAIAEVTGLNEIEADPTLYASGISMMRQGDFLNPHIDNSHDGDGRNYRVLNLLYYVSPDWELSYGGNLELWDARISEPRTILSRFNRLVVMETNQSSWHSVSKVLVDGTRLCVSNYYFSPKPTSGKAYSNVTTFAGRPDEQFKRFALGLDGLARNAIGKAFPSLLKRTKHRIRAESD